MKLGLSSLAAQLSLKKFGLNVIVKQKKRGLLSLFIGQFNNFLTVLLIFAALISLLIGEWLDGVLILAIVILNGLFGIYQELKADEAIDALKKMTVSKVRIIRDDKEIELDSRYIVPGDCILIDEGTKIPADGKIIENFSLQVNEAVLTGESLPVQKKIKDELFMGTIVSSGRGKMIVSSTGMSTRFGSIAEKLTEVKETKTPLQIKLEQLSKIIGIIGLVLSAFVFLISLVDGSGYFPSFLLAISLAVAVVPEGLPAVMTITLAIGMREMAKKNAIIRKLSAIEALGSVTLIVTDKTGTLTKNKISVKEVFIGMKNFGKEEMTHNNIPEIKKLLLNGVLCSTASLVYSHQKTQDVLGDPTEGAMLLLAKDYGWEPVEIKKNWKIIEERPFNSIDKKMTVKVKNREEEYVFTKGAFEVVVKSCQKILIGRSQRKITEKDILILEEKFSDWAKKGLRVLAFSYSEGLNSKEGDTFLGIAALHDPPRDEVKEAISRASKAGINSVMITGDNEKTAEAIGLSIGLLDGKGTIITGEQIDRYTDEELIKILPDVKIFARTTPFHKARIVQLYQKMGEIVAVTGDGVNDAIALKQADVGIAMGLIGTDVAREVADMVITDDNYATIVASVEEGRNIIKNIKNAVKYLLACNLCEALTLIIALTAGISNLFIPIQLLYINLITDGIPALSLSFSPRDPGLMYKKLVSNKSLLGKKDLSYIVVTGLAATILILTVFRLFLDAGFELSRTASFTVLALVQSFIFVDLWLSHQSIIKNIVHLKKPIFILGFLLTFVLQFFIVTNRTYASAFKITNVNYQTYFELILISSSILIIIGFLNRLFNFGRK